MSSSAIRNFDEVARRICEDWPELVLIGRHLMSREIPHSVVGIYFDGPKTKSNRGIYKTFKPLSLFSPSYSMLLCFRLYPEKDGVLIMDGDSENYVDAVYSVVKNDVIPCLEKNRTFLQIVNTVYEKTEKNPAHDSWIDFQWAWIHTVQGNFDIAVKHISQIFAIVERANLQRLLITDRFVIVARCKELIEQGNPAAVADFLRSLERANVAGYKFEKYYKPTVFPFER